MPSKDSSKKDDGKEAKKDGQGSKWKAWGRTAFDKSIVISDWAAGYANAGSAKLGGERFFPKTDDFPEEVEKCERILRAFTVEGVAADVKEVEVPDGKGSSMKKQRKVLRKIHPRLIKQAKGIVIYTSMRSGIAPFGGAGGVGLMLARLPDGSWSAPSSITPNNFALGLLLGFDIFDAILLINTETAMEKFKGHKVTLGAETAVAAGPFGAGITADMGMDRTPVYSYLRTRGMYGGVEAIAQVFLHRFDENERVYYWPGVTATDIFEGKVRMPPQVAPLHRALRDAETGIAQGDSLEKTVYENVNAPPNRAVKVLEAEDGKDMLQDGERLKLPPTPEELDAMEEAGIPDELDLEMERKELQEKLEAEQREREAIRRLPPPPRHPDVRRYWSNRPEPGTNRRVPPAFNGTRFIAPSIAPKGKVAMSPDADLSNGSQDVLDDKQRIVMPEGTEAEGPPAYIDDGTNLVVGASEKGTMDSLGEKTFDSSLDSKASAMGATTLEAISSPGTTHDSDQARPVGGPVIATDAASSIDASDAKADADAIGSDSERVRGSEQSSRAHGAEAGLESEAETDDFEDALTASESAPVNVDLAGLAVPGTITNDNSSAPIAEPISTPSATLRPLSPRPESVNSMDATSSNTSHGTRDNAASEGTRETSRPSRPPRARPVSSLIAEPPAHLPPSNASAEHPKTIAEEAPRMIVFLDWDETVTSQDTLSLVAPPAGTQHKGEDFAHYTKAYMDDLSAYEASAGDRDTLEKQMAFLEGIDEVEKKSVDRVEQGGLFTGAKLADMRQRAGTVGFRQGWAEADRWLSEATLEGQVEVDVISVGWSADFIRSALDHHRKESGGASNDDVTMPTLIRANEVEMTLNDAGEPVGTGKLTKSKDSAAVEFHDGQPTGSAIRTGIHKLNELKSLLARFRGSAPVSVYIGDSNTDLPCLLEAKYGLLMGANESLKATIERVGLGTRLMAAADWLEAGNKRHADQTLIEVRDWHEALGILKAIAQEE